MRLVIGKGSKRTAITFPTGKGVDVTPEHVSQLCQLLGVK